MAGSEDEDVYGVPLKVTLKAGGGFEAPWLTVEADTAEELAALLASLEATDVMERVVQASRSFRSKFSAAPSASKGDTGQSPVPGGSGSSSGTRSGEPSSSKPAAKQGSPSSSAPASGAAESTSADENVTAETGEDPIAAELNAATTLADLRKVFPKYKNNGWTDEHLKIATTRAAALQEASK